MSQDNKSQFFSSIVKKTEVQQDKNNNDYCTVSIESKLAVTRFNPFTKEEQMFKAKPASMQVKVRALKKMKEFAAS